MKRKEKNPLNQPTNGTVAPAPTDFHKTAFTSFCYLRFVNGFQQRKDGN